MYRRNLRGILQTFLDTLPGSEAEPTCLWIPFFILQIIFLIPNILFSHLKITHTGLELRDWPFLRYRYTWDEVSIIHSYSFTRFLSFDYLIIKDPKDPNNEKLKKRVYVIDQRKWIPLSGFRGWPNGRLAQDLQQYIPHIVTEWQEKKA